MNWLHKLEHFVLNIMKLIITVRVADRLHGLWE
jgi:hypothetical protein